MELRQLRYFVTLAETRNFHRAAERLNMSQPPLTVAIRKLEDELGTLLFVRGTRGVTLTPAGQASLEAAAATLAQAERFRESAREGATGERGRLRVGFVGSATFELLPRIIPEYRRRYPAVELVLEEATSVDIARQLVAGTLDVGLVRLPLTEMAAVDTTVIDPDEMHVAVHDASPLASADSVSLRALADEPFILQSGISVLHSVTLNACHAAGFVPTVAQEAAQLNAVLALVRSGLGVALVPSRAAGSMPQGVRLVRLADRVAIETGVALPRGSDSPLARNFASIASDS
ncbi:DNA-binding transcriptional LysR family regulator [Sphingobium sp. OAS761]|uniref:LysR family transcriptional regulator n=1 Tax=Sphingobium sp. OAS761 TaxID=2817901 RepID=UPI00209DC64B|nr:LysR family transcriptional regulator [Sphingobium sp. OAS761]MCP1471756.1 DNA-binding transcriptional LysR family regulator [Sphingobium sp. OAS761]